jgi:hypothetical protein
LPEPRKPVRRMKSVKGSSFFEKKEAKKLYPLGVESNG